MTDKSALVLVVVITVGPMFGWTRVGETGFQVSTNRKEAGLEQLRLGRNVEPGWLGVTLKRDDEILGIATVLPGSPAAEAGIERGDVILKADGTSFARVSDFADYIQSKKPGQLIRFLVKRSGLEFETGVTLGVEYGWLGIFFDRHNGILAIGHVLPGGPAAQAGIRWTDVILKADGTGFPNIGEFISYIKSTRPGQVVKLLIRRDGQETEVDLTLGRRPMTY